MAHKPPTATCCGVAQLPNHWVAVCRLCKVLGCCKCLRRENRYLVHRVHCLSDEALVSLGYNPGEKISSSELLNRMEDPSVYKPLLDSKNNPYSWESSYFE